jgi:hypothetical protein
LTARPTLVTGTTPPAVLDEPAVVHLGPARSVVARAGLLLGEVVVVPGAILYAFVAAGRPMLGLVAVFAWRVGCISARIGSGSRVPATCWLAFALFLARTVAGLAVSSVGLYLLVPVVLCAAQGVFFVGSAFTARPVMMRLAVDYAHRIPEHPALRGLFAELSALWGVLHLLCAGAGAWAITLSTTRAVALTSGLGLACTIGSVGGCVAWGLWRAARIPGLRVVYAGRREEPRPVQALPSAA